MSNSPVVYIYALVDPRDSAVRYCSVECFRTGDTMTGGIDNGHAYINGEVVAVIGMDGSLQPCSE